MKLRAISVELRDRLREMISDGFTNGSEIANSVGVAPAHISNVLKGKRGMSFELADALLEFAQLEVEELIPDKDLSERRPFVGSSQSHFISVPIVSPGDAVSPHIQERHARGTLLIAEHLAPKGVSANGRAHWHRFVAVESQTGETLVIDRHVYDGERQIAVKLGENVETGRLFLLNQELVFRPDDVSHPIIAPSQVVGRVIQRQKQSE